MADEWPLQDFLELGSLATAAGCARLHARQILWEWGVTELAEPVALLVSELLTNAAKASQVMDDRPPVRLWLLSDKQRVLILVWDANPQPPIRIDADLDAESGRGLILVESLSTQWDWYGHRKFGGKVVWALAAN
jgi:anti-sigma regulatory factor (Ser/Thr protein kinase)